MQRSSGSGGCCCSILTQTHRWKRKSQLACTALLLSCQLSHASPGVHLLRTRRCWLVKTEHADLRQELKGQAVRPITRVLLRALYISCAADGFSGWQRLFFLSGPLPPTRREPQNHGVSALTHSTTNHRCYTEHVAAVGLDNAKDDSFKSSHTNRVHLISSMHG